MIENTTTIDTLTGLVVFALGGKEYCADIKDISAIINPNELKEQIDLRSAKPIVNINNLLIPIINLYKYFNLKARGVEDNKRILAVEPGNKIFGFLVDRVKEIFTMNKDFREKIEFIPFNNEPYLLGVFNYEGRSLYLPDFNSFYKDLDE